MAAWVGAMLMLDTGSHDDTAQRAVACGARVAHFAWCDDFAAARNAALAQSQADWHLALAQLGLASDDAYLWYQLGKDHTAYGEHAQAADAFAHAVAASGPAAAPAPWYTDLAPCALFARKKAGRHEQAMALADQFLQTCGDSPDFFFALGDLLLDGPRTGGRAALGSRRWCAETNTKTCGAAPEEAVPT